MTNKYFYKTALKRSEPDMDAVKECAEGYKKTLAFVKTHFMKGNKLLCGDKISIADLLLSSSLEQVSSFNVQSFSINCNREAIPKMYSIM